MALTEVALPAVKTLDKSMLLPFNTQNNLATAPVLVFLVSIFSKVLIKKFNGFNQRCLDLVPGRWLNPLFVYN